MTPVQSPERSLQQRLDSLQKANTIRTFRAKMKREIKAKEKSAFEMLMNPPQEITTMKVFALLMAIPRFGQVKTNNVLRACRISPSKTVGGLSDRQRKELEYRIRTGSYFT